MQCALYRCTVGAAVPDAAPLQPEAHHVTSGFAMKLQYIGSSHVTADAVSGCATPLKEGVS